MRHGNGFATRTSPPSPTKAVITVSAAFTLLHLAGHIDPQGNHTALAAIDTLRAFYNHPEQLAR